MSDATLTMTTAEVGSDNETAVAVAVAVEAAAAAAPRRRRRLWELPTQAHELLLALSFEPDSLRREAARALGRMQRGICSLQGSDADVLYSVVHDMTTRNPLAESLHKRLDDRHAAAVRRCAPQRDPEALRAFWSGALTDAGMPAALWAVLTHPLGAALEKAVLHQARDWVFTQTRRAMAVKRTRELAEARTVGIQRTVDDLHERLAQQQLASAGALERIQLENAQLRGELLRRVGAAGEATGAGGREVPVDLFGTRPKLGAVAVVEASLRLRRRAEPLATLQSTTPAPAPQRSASDPVTVRGSRVLCVGGIGHSVSRYRSRVERLGGDFDHHDGGVEDSAQALDGRLHRADLVICQAACINHEAYRRIKRHCERTGKPCLYLDRPSLSRFDRALAALPGRGPTPAALATTQQPGGLPA